MRWSVLIAGAAACAALLSSQPAARLGDGVAKLRASFAHPPDDCRIMMRWWWFGPAVEKPELERELRAMEAGGIGGVEIQPVYPLTRDDPARGLVNLPYLSDGFLDAVRFANDKARELGMRVDITLGSGWPYGGPHTPIDLASGRLRVERLAVPAGAGALAMPRIGAGEQFLAAFLKRDGGFERITTIDDVGMHVSPRTPAGSAVLVFVASRTHQAVKRAAVGAEGLVLDHYSAAAIENHLHYVGDRLMQAFGAHPPYAVFSDSLEAYGSDWTGDFLSEFQKRRGYDLTPYLPALAGDVGEITASIRHDWGKTLTELANEHYLAPLRQWAAAHGTRFRSQNYGIPPVNLSSNALVDLPEGEGSAWRRFAPTRWASSASHLYGRPVTSSETWTWLHSPVFRATPLDMKAEADLHFLNGINQLVGHGWPYSPPQAGEPGWHFYAAAVFNQHNPWWIVMPEITAYLQRVSWLLRQGEPVNDVALYLPTADAYAGFTLGHDSVDQAMDRLLGPRVIPQILDGGYNYDFIDDDAIAAVGIKYPVLVLPNVERMPLKTLIKIAEYAHKGGIVIATGRFPSLAPGFLEAKTDTPQIREIANALFEAPDARGHLVKDDAKLAETLHELLKPDVTAPPEIGFVHRRIPSPGHGFNVSYSADVYFLVNTANHRAHGPTWFRGGPACDSWDPFTGKMTLVAQVSRGGLSFEPYLAPYESRIVEACPPGLILMPPDSEGARPPPVLLDLSAGWKVAFAGSPQPVTTDQLTSWTEVPGMKNFSGTATYEKAFAVDAAMPKDRRRLYLDFGEGTPVTTSERRTGNGMRAMLESPVREAAIVYVNGKRAGSVWHPPYEIEITGLLHGGENTLRIVVANLAINALAAQPSPDYRALIAKYGNRFQDQDMKAIEPLPAGILGSVRIVGR
ncbi:MAG: glycosyl hydrolase [Bryobacteraceae bacterium]